MATRERAREREREKKKIRVHVYIHVECMYIYMYYVCVYIYDIIYIYTYDLLQPYGNLTAEHETLVKSFVFVVLAEEKNLSPDVQQAFVSSSLSMRPAHARINSAKSGVRGKA